MKYEGPTWKVQELTWEVEDELRDWADPLVRGYNVCVDFPDLVVKPHLGRTRSRHVGEWYPEGWMITPSPGEESESFWAFNLSNDPDRSGAMRVTDETVMRPKLPEVVRALESRLQKNKAVLKVGKSIISKCY